jgi:hypothetical protein
MKRLLFRLLPALALPVLAGCAIAPGYTYSGGGDGGYYYGNDVYGGAGTVIYDDRGYGGYYDPWGYAGYGGYYGGRVGTTIYYYDAHGHRHYRSHRRNEQRRHYSHHDRGDHRSGNRSHDRRHDSRRHESSHTKRSRHRAVTPQPRRVAAPPARSARHDGHTRRRSIKKP